ncbi:type II toxin-antitoxin system HicA family toxin [Pseudanabaena sp. SR411]|uniref:type II toxin-antitoxin system HicA family toxin n=1 Tax=Pseudanabaena sp. SR411 TaxID=1980935 RepID=UPI0034E94316
MLEGLGFHEARSKGSHHIFSRRIGETVNHPQNRRAESQAHIYTENCRTSQFRGLER